VARRIEVAEKETILQSLRDAGETTRDLSGDKGLAATRTLVVEQDAVAGVNPVALPVVHGDPIRIQLGHAVWTPRIKRRGLPLRCLVDKSEQFRARGLVEPRLV